MKLQTALLILASVVSVHSQVENAPVLSQCLELIKSGATQSTTNPDIELGTCLVCTEEVETNCLPGSGGDLEVLAQRLTEDSSQAQCAEAECVRAVSGPADARMKRDVNKRCRGRLCGN